MRGATFPARCHTSPCPSPAKDGGTRASSDKPPDLGRDRQAPAPRQMLACPAEERIGPSIPEKARLLGDETGLSGGSAVGSVVPGASSQIET